MNKTITWLRLAAVAAVLLLASGCAFGTRHAVLLYPPELAKSKDARPIHGAASSGGNLGKIALRPFGDERPNKTIAGYVRNGYGMKMAQVHLGTNVAEVVTSAVRYELERLGYQVVTVEQIDIERNIPLLTGHVLALSCDAFMSYEGEASIQICLNRDGQEVFKRTYVGTGSTGANWTAAGASYGLSMSLALEAALKSFKRDLPLILKQ